MPPSQQQHQVREIIAAGSFPSPVLLHPGGRRRGAAMGLRPHPGVGLAPYPASSGQRGVQRFGQHLGLLAEGEPDVAAARSGWS